MTLVNVNRQLETAMGVLAKLVAGHVFPRMAAGMVLIRRGQLARVEGFDVHLHAPGTVHGTVYLGQSVNAHPVMVIRRAGRTRGRRMRWASAPSFLWPSEVGEWQVVDPSVEPAYSLLAELAKWESPASPFLGNPEDLPGNPNEYGDAG